MLIVWIEFLLCSAIIVICGANLSRYGDVIAEKTGLGRAWIGFVLMASVTSLPELITGISSVALAGVPNIALTTSLPELVVSISALKIGATDMAIANLFGSNIFNIFILAIDDIFYVRGPLLTDVSMNHAVTGFMSVVMTGIAIVGLTYRLERKTFLRLGWDAIAILLAYFVNIYLLYSLRGRG